MRSAVQPHAQDYRDDPEQSAIIRGSAGGGRHRRTLYRCKGRDARSRGHVTPIAIHLIKLMDWPSLDRPRQYGERFGWPDHQRERIHPHPELVPADVRFHSGLVLFRSNRISSKRHHKHQRADPPRGFSEAAGNAMSVPRDRGRQSSASQSHHRIDFRSRQQRRSSHHQQTGAGKRRPSSAC